MVTNHCVEVKDTVSVALTLAQQLEQPGTPVLSRIKALLARADARFHYCLPAQYLQQGRLTAALSREVRSVFGYRSASFTNAELVRNGPVNPHFDHVDVPGTYDVAIILGKPGTEGQAFQGGSQLLLQRGIEIVTSKPGTMVFCNYHTELHAVTNIERPGDASRIVLIGFNNGKVEAACTSASTAMMA